MGKIVKGVLALGIAVGAAFAAPYLGPIIGKLLGGGALAMKVGTAIASVAVALVAGMAMKMLAGMPSSRAQPINFRQAIGNSWIIIGKRRAGGQMVFVHGRKDGKKHYRYFIFASAGHRCSGVTRWWLNDEVVTVDGAGKVTSGAYANAAWLWFGRGQYDVDETPSGWRAETGGKWTDNHVGYGVGKIYAKFELTDKVIETGMPTVSAEIEGSDEIVDPRTGVAGHTDLAIPAFYWWMRLPREEGGFGADADEIPDDTLLSAWTNICDEDVPLAGGGTEKRYTFDSLIETGSEPSKVRQTFEICCAGTFCQSEGQFMLRPGYWVPATTQLLERDLAAPFSVPLLTPSEEYATEVNGTFVDPGMNYQPQPIPTRRVTADNVRQLDFDLAHVTSHTRGQRILEIMLRRAQCEKRVNWTMNIAGLAIVPMQTVTLSTTRYGLSNYAWVVDSWGLQQDFSVPLQLREENSDIYAWTTAMEIARATTGTLAPIEPVEAERGAFQLLIPPDPSPLSSDDDSIAIAAFTAVIDDGTAVEFPVGSVTGLTAETTYGVFFKLADETYLAVIAPATTQMASDEYVFIGWFATTA